MSFVGDAIGSIVGGITGASDAADAGRDASRAQVALGREGIAEQRRQFDFIQALLKPYVESGTAAFGEQAALGGAKGAAAQQTAINALQQSPEFLAALQQGEEGILQNASATGGLRGGNTQGALSQFRPQLLAQTISDRYNRLGGLAQTGLGAATQTGSFGAQATNNVSNLLQQVGAAQAGGILAMGNRNRQAFGDLLQIGGTVGRAFGGF